jgi:hypothetical protein
MTPWEDMELFRHVLVTDCFVLSWAEHDGSLTFEVEASLWPGHPLYSKPPKTDWTCYRKATLRFPGVRRIEGLRTMAETPSTTDPDDSIDYGSFHGLHLADDGRYHLSGDFGEVTIESDPLVFEIH